MRIREEGSRRRQANSSRKVLDTVKNVPHQDSIVQVGACAICIVVLCATAPTGPWWVILPAYFGFLTGVVIGRRVTRA